MLRLRFSEQLSGPFVNGNFFMKCKICQQTVSIAFQSKLLRKHQVNYYSCEHCGFVSTEEPYWLDEAYEQSINCSDTGIIKRNIQLSRILSLILFSLFKHDAKFLDFAGGYGIFTRMMRDAGYDFYWQDQYSDNLVAKGFDADNEQEFELISCIEAFEHFVEPVVEIEKLFAMSSTIFFTTELLPKPVPEADSWWYYGLEHGQHISFYSEKTLHYIAKKYHVYYCGYNNLHLFSRKKISPLVFKLLIKLSRLPLSSLLAIFVHSKTQSDSAMMSEKE